VIGAADTAAAIDERIKHQVQELRPKMVTKLGGSVPPLLKKLLSELATLHWLTLKMQLSALGQLTNSIKVQRRQPPADEVTNLLPK
jgi:hypothetical protein